MYIVLNEQGNSWDGLAWGWRATRRFTTVPAAIRSLQEAGEDIDSCNIIEDVFVHNENRITAKSGSTY
jgi:hypothetical protein